MTREYTKQISLFILVIIDIDECSTNSHSCDVNADCSNTQESYTCTCKAGYSGDGISCSGTLIFVSLRASVLSLTGSIIIQ